MRPAHSKFVAQIVALLALFVATAAWAASPQLSAQTRIGLVTGDQWEPAVAADSSGHIFALYPHYGRVPDCTDCSVPTMLLIQSNDNGKTWLPPHVMLESGSGQFDPQIAVDPADRHTVYAAWLQNRKREVMLAKSVDSGATWAFTIAVRSDEELDKPALAVRGQSVYVAFNHEEEVWVAASQDGGRSFTPTRVNAESRPGWSLLGCGHGRSRRQRVSGVGFLLKGRRSARLGEPVCGEVRGCGQDLAPTLLDVSAAAPDCKDEDCGEGYLGAQVALASDADGTLYALWSAGSTAMGAQRIYFSSSTNGGESWQLRSGVSSAAAGVEHAFPAIVAGNNGDVRIAWMDTRRADAPRLPTGIPSTAVPATAAQPGLKKPASPATFPATPTSSWQVLAFPSATISAWPSTTTAIPTSSGAKA